MTERDRAAVDVDLRPVPALVGEGVTVRKDLRGEGLVELDQIHVHEFPSNLFQQDGDGYAQAADEPKYLFRAPALAIPILLKKIGWKLADVDLIELNEAFAAQVLADGYALADQGWDWAKVNVNGGAIALGHPIGASGARLLATLIYALKDRGVKKGIASLCLGGSEAVAMAVEVE